MRSLVLWELTGSNRHPSELTSRNALNQLAQQFFFYSSKPLLAFLLRKQAPLFQKFRNKRFSNRLTYL